MSSIFTKIINGELPCYKIHEDELTITFLTIQPIQLGHTLIVPKKEVNHFIDADDESFQRVFYNAKKIGKAIHKATGCKRVGAAIVGFEVPHFHYHLIPMYDASDLDFKKAKSRTEEEMKDIQNKITSALSSL